MAVKGRDEPETLSLGDDDVFVVWKVDGTTRKAKLSTLAASLPVNTITVAEVDGTVVNGVSRVEVQEPELSVTEPTAGTARVALGAHGAVHHDGSVFPVDSETGAGQPQNLGATYIDLPQIAAPADPPAGVRRLFTNSATGETSVRTSGSSTVSLESVGGGSGAPVDAAYIVGAANGTLSNELVLGTGVIMKGTLASRPAAATAGRLYYVTDSGSQRWTRDTGSAWEDCSPAASQVSGLAASATTDTTNASNIASGTLPAARLPAATTSVQGGVILATPSSDVTAGHVVQASDARLSDSRGPSGAAGGDLGGTYPSPSVQRINGVALSGLATGILKNTTGTGVPSIAVAADFPTLNQNTTGSAASLSASAAANQVLATPASGGSSTPSLRALVAADLPAATTSAKGAVVLSPDRETTAGEVVSADDYRMARPWQRVSFVDHFLGAGDDSSGTLQLAWIQSGVGPLEGRAPEVGHPGILRLNSLNTDSDAQGLAFRDDLGIGTIKAADVDNFGWRVRLGAVDGVRILFGLSTSHNVSGFSIASGGLVSDDSPGGPDSVLFEFDPSGTETDNWWYIKRSGSSTTTADTGVLGDTGWHDFEVRREASVWRWKIDGISVGTSTNAGPTASLLPMFAIWRDSASRHVDLDVTWLESGPL